MLCPHCELELVVDAEWSDSDIDFSGSDTVEGSVTFNLFCGACSESLVDHELEFEQDVSDFVNEHSDHCEDEFTAEVRGETFTKHRDSHNTEHVGASFTIYVQCTCGREAIYEYSDDAPLEDVLGELD